MCGDFIICILTKYYQACQIREGRWAECAAGMGDMIDADTILIGKPTRKRPAGRLRRSWEGNGS
jgi:hypothetical protein